MRASAREERKWRDLKNSDIRKLVGVRPSQESSTQCSSSFVRKEVRQSTKLNGHNARKISKKKKGCISWHGIDWKKLFFIIFLSFVERLVDFLIT